MITPNDILAISEPVEKMYMDCTAQLIINIAKHFATGKGLSTAEWETQKLSELGALTDESIEIIAANCGQAPEAIRKAVTEGMGISVKEAENTLSKAADKGVIQGASMSWEASERVRGVVKTLSDQAIEQSNIVNTVMLRSTQARYVNAVQYAATEEAALKEQKLIEKLQSVTNAVDLAAQLEKTQTALNAATMNVAVGAEARTTALRRTILKLADEGITGYVDAGGHHWTPEAYINMDIRTTVHNAAVEGQKARAEDYGVSTFQISSHAGARPLCADYQGKFYSWDGSEGFVEDLYGNKYHYEGIGNTSYGKPAGIFGINCGHSPITFVSGYNIPRFEPTQDDAKNKEQYELSQKQRYLERQIRDEKTKAIALDAAGEKEAFTEAAKRIKEKNTQYKEFCAANNLTERKDRTQVFAYNRSISSKANLAARNSGVTETDTAKVTLHSTPQIKYADAVLAPKYDSTRAVIDALAGQYNTKLQEVRIGAQHAAGEVQISGTVMKISSAAPHNAVHEFAHTLTMEAQVKLGLSNNAEKEFWNEIKKVQREYKREVADDPKRWISAYEHSAKGSSEFMAEAFTQIKTKELGYELPNKYGDDTTYSRQVVAVIDKYFKKR